MSDLTLTEKERRFALLSYLKKKIDEQLKTLREEILESHKSDITNSELKSFSISVGGESTLQFTRKAGDIDTSKLEGLLEKAGLDKEVAFDKKVETVEVASPSKLANMLDLGMLSKEEYDSLFTTTISLTPKLSDNDKNFIEESL